MHLIFWHSWKYLPGNSKPFLKFSCLYRFLSDNNIRPDFFCQYDKILKSAQSAIKNQQQSTQNQKPNKQSSAIKSQKQLTVKQKPNELLYQSKGVKGITQLKGKTCTYLLYIILVIYQLHAIFIK